MVGCILLIIMYLLRGGQRETQCEPLSWTQRNFLLCGTIFNLFAFMELQDIICQIQEKKFLPTCPIACLFY